MPSRRPSLALAAFLAIASSAPLVAPSAQSPTPVLTPVSGVQVVATGEEQITPDRAKVSIGVQTQAPTAADASSRNARLQRAVMDTLRALGIAADQLSTTGYNVYPEQQFNEQTRRPRIVGYNVQNTILVDVRRIDQVGPVLDAALAKGANNVSGLHFYSSTAEAARRRALARAVENARADAEAMARAAGGTLGELLDLHSGITFAPPQPMYEMDMAKGRAAAMAAPTPIAEGTQTVTATATARWRFVPAPR